jgi:hypothetical protein
VHIALLPADPIHTKEHMTLVWVGSFKLTDSLNDAQDNAVDLCDIVTNLLNRYIKMKGPLPVRINGSTTYGGTYVAQASPGDNILYTFRELCERLGLNHSQFKDWKPHISAPRRDLLRPPGTFVYIHKAEMR